MGDANGTQLCMTYTWCTKEFPNGTCISFMVTYAGTCATTCSKQKHANWLIHSGNGHVQSQVTWYLEWFSWDPRLPVWGRIHVPFTYNPRTLHLTKTDNSGLQSIEKWVLGPNMELWEIVSRSKMISKYVLDYSWVILTHFPCKNQKKLHTSNINIYIYIYIYRNRRASSHFNEHTTNHQ